MSQERSWEQVQRELDKIDKALEQDQAPLPPLPPPRVEQAPPRQPGEQPAPGAPIERPAPEIGFTDDADESVKDILTEMRDDIREMKLLWQTILSE